MIQVKRLDIIRFTVGMRTGRRECIGQVRQVDDGAERMEVELLHNDLPELIAVGRGKEGDVYSVPQKTICSIICRPSFRKCPEEN